MKSPFNPKKITNSKNSKKFVILFLIICIIGFLGLIGFWPFFLIGFIVFLNNKRKILTWWNNKKQKINKKEPPLDNTSTNQQPSNFNIFSKQFSKSNFMEQTKNTIHDISSRRKKVAYFVILVIIIGIILINSVKIIEAGETGVYSLFGKVKDNELSSGIHLINPLAKITRMSTRTEEYTMSIASEEGNRKGMDPIKSLTKEGLSIDLDITVLYRLNEKDASQVYESVGVGFSERIIRPAIRSAIREVVANYEAREIYADKRVEANLAVEKKLKDVLEPRGIVLENVLLRNIELPAGLAQSIQAKLQAEQEAQRYDFLLDKERKEKERKIIEAEGQRDSQKIINESLTPTYLNYLYVNNLKDRQGTIYVPTNPQTGMPVFVMGQ